MLGRKHSTSWDIGLLSAPPKRYGQIENVLLSVSQSDEVRQEKIRKLSVRGSIWDIPGLIKERSIRSYAAGETTSRWGTQGSTS